VAVESRTERLTADGSTAPALSITELYRRADRALRSTFPTEVWVTGEIRSLKVLPRGHCFIDLVDPTNAKDSAAPMLSVKCWSTQWRSVCSTLDRLGIALESGTVVRARGEVQLYKARGTVDFVLRELDTDALLGKVAAERARLIKALVDEGLFDRQRRLPVAVPSLRVGLVASPDTEGCNDFLGGLRGSGLGFAVTLASTAVQGRNASARVAKAITRLGCEPLDLIVVVRGGGSKADLATFDTEPVARAIATCPVPVWTGIGHTGDHSVADEVANRSHITPTECGQELASSASAYWQSCADAGGVIARMARDRVARAGRSLDRKRHGMATGARAQTDRHSDRLAHTAGSLRGAVRSQLDAQDHRLSTRGTLLARSAARSLVSGNEALVFRSRRLAQAAIGRSELETVRTSQWRRLLDAYDYQRQLERGYSVTRNAEGQVVRSVADVERGSSLVTLVADGRLVSSVTDVRAEPAARAEPKKQTGLDAGGTER